MREDAAAVLVDMLDIDKGRGRADEQLCQQTLAFDLGTRRRS